MFITLTFQLKGSRVIILYFGLGGEYCHVGKQLFPVLKDQMADVQGVPEDICSAFVAWFLVHPKCTKVLSFVARNNEQFIPTKKHV